MAVIFHHMRKFLLTILISKPLSKTKNFPNHHNLVHQSNFFLYLTNISDNITRYNYTCEKHRNKPQINPRSK